MRASPGWPRQGRLSKERTDFVIIPEPLRDRICIGHRGVYWFAVETKGRIAHGSMPFHGVSAIDHMNVLLARMRTELLPRLAARTTAMPVDPPARDGLRSISTGSTGASPCTGSRPLAWPTGAARCSIGGSCSRKDSTSRSQRSLRCSNPSVGTPPTSATRCRI